MTAYRQSDPVQPTPWRAPAWLEHLVWHWFAGWFPRAMALGLWLLMIALHLVVAGGCNQTVMQVQAQTATAVASAANAALPVLVERYRREGIEIVLAVKQRGGTADEARDLLQGLKDRWAPVWEAWEGLRIAQDAWADSIEGGGSPAAAAAALKDAYCGLMLVWPEDIPAVPLAPLSCAKEAIP